MSSQQDTGEKPLTEKPSSRGMFGFKRGKPPKVEEQDADSPPSKPASDTPDLQPVSFTSMFRLVNELIP